MDVFAYLNSSTTLALIVAFCLYFILRNSTLTKRKSLPPKADGGWPIIGHLLQLSKGELPHIVLGAMADKHGPIFRISLGVKPTVVVNSAEIAKEIFTAKDLATASRPKMVSVKIMGYNYALFAFAPYGAYWRQVRKMTTLELLSNRRIELLKRVRVMEVQAWLQELHKFSTSERKDRSSGDSVVVEMKKWFEDLTMNVILRMVVGKRVFGTGAEGGEDEARRCQKVTRDMMRLFGVFAMRDAVPFLGWLDVGKHEKAMGEVAKEWDCLLSKWLEEHKRKGGKEEMDFMDVMIGLLDGTDLAGFDADSINKSTCLTMILGGSDTTATTLTWAMSLLLNNPNTLKKVQEELDIHVGKERLVQESDITNLVYLQAVVKETMRLYAPAPLSGPREVIEDCSIGGYFVPKGTRIIMNLWKIQTDPKIWTEPLKFKPERFLETHKHVSFKGQDYEWIPFGGGRRACPGVAFATQLLPFALASFVQAFEFSIPTDGVIDMTGSVGLTNAKATPLEIKVSPRLSSDIYGN